MFRQFHNSMVTLTRPESLRSIASRRSTPEAKKDAAQAPVDLADLYISPGTNRVVA